MSYLAKYYAMAEESLNRRRVRSEEVHLENIKKAVTEIPQLEKMLAELSNDGVKLASVLVSGGDVKKETRKIAEENIAVQTQIKALLREKNFPDDLLNPIYSCEKCRDTGVFNGKRCSCFMNDVKKFQCEDLNKVSAMNLCSFESFDISYYPESADKESNTSIRRIMEDNFKYCKEYAEDFHIPYGGILMSGKTGLGKTHLSLSIGKEVIEKGYSVIYGSAPDLLRKAEREHFGNDENVNTMRLLQECDLLIFDDLGAEFESKFYNSTIYNILNTRMNAGRPCIVSTNLSNSELNERYGDRITSRLITMEILVFLGNDIRMIKRYAE